jgi:hypothetical protein
MENINFCLFYVLGNYYVIVKSGVSKAVTLFFTEKEEEAVMLYMGQIFSMLLFDLDSPIYAANKI